MRARQLRARQLRGDETGRLYQRAFDHLPVRQRLNARSQHLGQGQRACLSAILRLCSSGRQINQRIGNGIINGIHSHHLHGVFNRRFDHFTHRGQGQCDVRNGAIFFI